MFAAVLRKLVFILSFIFAAMLGSAQTLVVNGTVSCNGAMQDGVLIDVYENSSPIQTLHTDKRGLFVLRLTKGKEYLVVFYKSGYILQSVSIVDSRENLISNYFLKIDLDRDEKSPEGLYFKNPVKRITPDVMAQTFIESKFSIDRIKPHKRADSVLVLLNRAEANQYILVGNMKLASSPVDTRYSRQIGKNIEKEVAAYSDKLKQNIRQYDSLYKEEDKHQQATMTTTGDKQLDEITETQRLLAERLRSITSHYLLEQQQMLARARLDDMDALRYDRDPDPVSDTIRIYVRDKAKRARSKAMNDRYRAMDANRKFLLYNKYQEDNYQEYIELLRYKDNKKDTMRTASARPAPPAAMPLATIAPADTSDNLSKMNDEQRTKLIREALDEEERFKNYTEKTEVKTINGEELAVTDIHIADDNYEMQVDKKKNARYFKNSKPITRITFEFETTRRMVDVLHTIRQVEKFGK
jgi:hypothetical protein